jgi:hypothetical protein
MFGSAIIDVAIGLVFVFVFVSLVASSVAEGIEGILKTRAMDLEKGIREILNDPTGEGMTKKIFDHPLIHALFVGDYDPEKIKQDIRWPWKAPQSHMRWLSRRNLPSYVPGASFAAALLDIVARGAVPETKSDPPAAAGGAAPSPPPGPSDGGGGPQPEAPPDPAAKELNLAAWRAAADKIGDEKLRRALLTALDYGKESLEDVRANLSAWFDSAMDRVSGWYKRRVQLMLFFIGLLAAVVLNVDAITTATRLVNDNTLRDSIVALAEKAAPPTTQGDQSPDATGGANGQPSAQAALNLPEVKAELANLGFPMGWKDWRPGPQFAVCYKVNKKGVIATKRSCEVEEAAFIWARTVVGWLVTAFAVMFGAPFWFDLLGKLVTLRASGKLPSERKQEEQPG